MECQDLLSDPGSLEACRAYKHGQSWMVNAVARPTAATCPHVALHFNPGLRLFILSHFPIYNNTENCS